MTNEFKQTVTELTKAPREILSKKGMSPYENPDKQIALKGIAWLQNEVERDTHYMSAVTTRINALIKKGYHLQPGSSDPRDIEIRDFVQYCLDNMDSEFETDVAAMMSAISRGFSLTEINYRLIDKGAYKGKFGLRNLRFKQQQWFTFKYDDLGYYIPVQWDPQRIELPLDKFIHIINGMDDENPYGFPIASICSFYTWLKKNEFKFWAIFSERFGMPLPKVEVPQNTVKGDAADLAATALLEAVQYDTGVKVPKNLALEFMEAMRAGDAGYANFVKMCNAEISKAVLGETLTVENTQGTGSGGMANVHSDVLSIYSLFDVIISQSAINRQLIRKLVDINYPDVVNYPKLQWKLYETGLMAVVAQALPQLQQAGVKISASWVYDVLRMAVPEDEDDVLEPQQIGGVPGLSGVDNQARNVPKYGKKVPGARFQVLGEEEEQNLRFKMEDLRLAEDADGLVVSNGEKNERLIDKYIPIYAQRYSDLVRDIIKYKSFNPDTFPRRVESEIAPILQEIFVLGTLKGRADVVAETTKIKNGREEQRGTEQNRTNSPLIPLFTKEGGVENGGDKIVEFAVYKPFDKLIEDYLKRGVITRSEYDLLSEEMKRRSFTVARVESDTVLNLIKDKLEKVLRGKLSNTDFEAEVQQIFDEAGLTVANAGHLETVLRTNLQTTYGDGRAAMFDQMDGNEFPAIRLVAIMDSRVRANHAALHGFTRLKNDPIWKRLKTPRTYNCRCTLRAVHKDENYVISEVEPDLSGDFSS